MNQKMNQQKAKEKMIKKQQKEEKRKAKITKKQNKEKKKINLNYWDKKWYKVLGDILIVVNLMIAVLSLYIAVLVRQDTEELTKMSEKDLYYTIRLYPTENTKEYEEYENYIRLPFYSVAKIPKAERNVAEVVNSWKKLAKGIGYYSRGFYEDLYFENVIKKYWEWVDKNEI